MIIDHEYRIYADDRASIWAVVDEEDFLWAIRWRWNLLNYHGGNRKPKRYLRRTVSLYTDGVRSGSLTLLLHVEILKRTGIKPPSERHTLVDHIDGDSFNCKRGNLIWATSSENNRRKRHAPEFA